ncbi:MAG: hypothetical protein FJZ01_17105 [Candidatus Sericytochromatia bacterium]|nr:hypothetical protein [Candidatus Tanganyikabacteria bacterium]
MPDKKKMPTPAQLAQQIRDFSANGSRAITIFSDARKPLRDFIVTYVSEEGGGYLAGHEKNTKRVITMKFSEISEVRI